MKKAKVKIKGIGAYTGGLTAMVVSAVEGNSTAYDITFPDGSGCKIIVEGDALSSVGISLFNSIVKNAIENYLPRIPVGVSDGKNGEMTAIMTYVLPENREIVEESVFIYVEDKSLNITCSDGNLVFYVFFLYELKSNLRLMAGESAPIFTENVDGIPDKDLPFE